MAKRYSDAYLARLRNKMGENIPVPKERKKRTNEEAQIQGALIVWWGHACRAFDVPEPLLFAIPNGGWRDMRTAVALKREGVRKGTSDLFLAVPRRASHGLFIEMKRPGGVIQPEQKTFLAAVGERGYGSIICYSFDEAVAAITKYLT